MDEVGAFLSAHPAGVGTTIALFSLLGLFPAARRRRQLQSAPLIKARGAFIGLVQIEGLIRCDQPVTSYLAEADVAHFRYSVDEHWRRTVTESYRDSQGRSRTRTRVESGWTTVQSGGESRLFEIVDETGAIRIDPEGATIDAPAIFEMTVGRDSRLYYGKGPTGAVANSTGTRRFVETALVPGASTYVVGTARERADVAELEIARGELDPIFLIDKDGHRGVVSGFGWRAGGFLALALVSLAVGIYYQATLPTPVPEIAVGLTLFVCAYVIGFCVATINGLGDVRRRVDQAASNLDVHLRRRYDLLPRLAECVRGYAEHETDVRGSLARGGAAAIAERYPDLAGQPVFRRLQTELADTEERVALARGYLAAAHSLERAQTERFPASLFARALDERPSFLPETEAESPERDAKPVMMRG